VFGRAPRRRVLITAVVVIVLLPVTWSYGDALRAPGNTAFSVRSVEWLKDHHLRSVVNNVENFWYTHHRPKKGGAPSGQLAAAIRAAAAPTTTLAPTPTTAPGPLVDPEITSLQARALPPPQAIPPIVASPLPGEGQWSPLGQTVVDKPAMYAAYVRPDPVYTSLVTGVAWIDTELVRFKLFAGVQEPGGTDWKNQAPMGAADRANLLAAFNSGFKLSDSGGGYYAEGKMVRPLKDGGATLTIFTDGVPTIGQWGRDVSMDSSVAFARQNLSLIVDNSQPVPGLDTDSLDKWGATLGNKVQVWRSGIGVTASGAIVYAAGNNLSISMLANVLSRAGAVRAMELDINSAWVDFVSYGPATPSPAVPDTQLLPDMSGGTGKYLSDNSRDFLAVFRRL
jgi:Phosphodiester glycosidase